MGSKGSKPQEDQQGDGAAGGAKVILNVYSMTEQPSLPGFGVWHSGVEVNGVEYTFGRRETSLSGVASHKPRGAPGVTFKEAVEIGTTSLTGRQIRELINTLSKEYLGNQYHITGKNCNHFSEELCQRLCGASIPGWVNRAAKVTHAVGLGGFASKTATSQAEEQAAAALAAAPTGQSTFTSIQVDLSSVLDLSVVECLNEDAAHPLASILAAKPKRGACLRSDADPQLLLGIGFTQHVRLSSLAVRAPAASGPRRLHLYAGRRNLDFSSIESVDPTVVMELSADDVASGRCVAIPSSQLFTNVKDLTVFVTENQGGGEITEISKIAFIGSPLLTTNMSQFKAVAPNALYLDAD